MARPAPLAPFLQARARAADAQLETPVARPRGGAGLERPVGGERHVGGDDGEAEVAADEGRGQAVALDEAGEHGDPLQIQVADARHVCLRRPAQAADVAGQDDGDLGAAQRRPRAVRTGDPTGRGVVRLRRAAGRDQEDQCVRVVGLERGAVLRGREPRPVGQRAGAHGAGVHEIRRGLQFVNERPRVVRDGCPFRRHLAIAELGEQAGVVGKGAGQAALVRRHRRWPFGPRPQVARRLIQPGQALQRIRAQMRGPVAVGIQLQRFLRCGDVCRSPAPSW